MLVVREDDFKRLAIRTHWNDQPIYSMSFGMHPHSNSRWLPFLVPTGHLAERLSPSPRSGGRVGEGGVKEVRPPMWRSAIGFLGESEVVRLLAEGDEINVFRPFPDLETAEIAVLHLENRHVLGVQVKTGAIAAGQSTIRINIRASSFRPSPTTYFVVLAWVQEEHQFHEDCLFIPSDRIRSVCQPSELDGHITFDWTPTSGRHSHVDPFRIPIRTLRVEIENRLRRYTGDDS